METGFLWATKLDPDLGPNSPQENWAPGLLPAHHGVPPPESPFSHPTLSLSLQGTDWEGRGKWMRKNSHLESWPLRARADAPRPPTLQLKGPQE